ncbi:MAG: MinD/ParA family protein [Gammaproteobacteria bacterium]|nr:MinD/ParA family protein [Gammaproteobacteria bacterium]
MQHTVTSLFGNSEQQRPQPTRARVIAITSGKGGVGKTNITTNLAISLARQGKRVCIFDADTGLANINILLGLTPQHTLEDFLEGSLPLEDILMEGPRGVRIVPGASGIAEYADLDRHRQQTLLNGLRRIEDQFDYLLIDTAAGISDAVIQFVLATELAILVVSPDPTSLTDSFALTRVLKRNEYAGRIEVLVNMAESQDAAQRVYQRFSQAVSKYLQLDLKWFGYVSADRAVVSAIRLQHPVVLMQPDAPASQCFERLASHLQETCATESGPGMSEFLRSRVPETAVDPAQAAIDLIRGAQPTRQIAQEANLGDLHRQFIDCIQGSKGGAEELVAAIKPIIDAYVARFHSFPLDMREAIYRYLEMGDFPDHEIRNQVMLLEQLYEKRYQRPLMDKEDSLFRLLNQVRDSEPEFADAIARLQHSYERQYHPGPQEALSALLERLKQPGVMEDDFVDCIETLRHEFAERFGRNYTVSDLALRERVSQLIAELADREAARQDTLAILSSEIEQSSEHLARLQAVLNELDGSG